MKQSKSAFLAKKCERPHCELYVEEHLLHCPECGKRLPATQEFSGVEGYSLSFPVLGATYHFWRDGDEDEHEGVVIGVWPEDSVAVLLVQEDNREYRYWVNFSDIQE